MSGFLKLKKTDATEQLLSYPAGFMLLTQIALRAKRDNSFNAKGLQKGQAFIGDISQIGITARQYRTAKEKLTDWGFASFKTTNKGTIATILNTDIYDINEEDSDKQETIKGQTKDKPETTNKKVKKIRNKENITINPIIPLGETSEIDFQNPSAANTETFALDVKHDEIPPIPPLPPLPFSEFWDRYDHKQGNKKKAQEKWNSLDRATQVLIMNGVDAYSKSFSPERKKYQPHPSTFLNQARWETDDFLKPEASDSSVKKNVFQTNLKSQSYSPETTIEAGMRVIEEVKYINEQRALYPERYEKHPAKGWQLKREYRNQINGTSFDPAA